MACVRVKFGAKFDRLDPAGIRILGSIDRITRECEFDVTITCGTDGHPASDPHALGRAFDVRTHDLTIEQKRYLLRAVLLDLQEGPFDAPSELPEVPFENLATRRFFGQLEYPGEDREHCHFQQRRGVMFP